MNNDNTIRKVLAENQIFVPTYQRAYSWDTETEKGETPRQVNVFLSDLEDYVQSSTKSQYYFGHFLFEKTADNKFGVIDGQQRLTTIVIFLSALYKRLKDIRPLTDEEDFTYKCIVKIGGVYRLTTVDYDNQLFKDYVIEQVKKDHNGLDTESQKRIVAAFDYFCERLNHKSDSELAALSNAVQNATCTTHLVDNESEAIQMFIFQNNRGKKPSNLEIIKAQFMYNVHLYGGSEKDNLITEIKNRFEKIYKSIATIEQKINEDDVLLYTQRIYFNSLWEGNTLDKVNGELSKSERIDFIKKFTHSLATSFEHATSFFGKDERDSIFVHSLVALGSLGIVMPFIIKAYSFDLKIGEINKLCEALESIIIRDRVIGTRADITPRLNNVFQKFDGSVAPIDECVNWMKAQTGYWGYWNNDELKRALQGAIYPATAKFLLWKYENHLVENEGKTGYFPIRFDSIKKPHLEHIAPKTENPQSGYCEYDDDFKDGYLDCLGNYLLLSALHNTSIGNISFERKRATYTQLRQQIEVQQMTETDRIWDKEKINTRHEKIIKFILENF